MCYVRADDDDATQQMCIKIEIEENEIPIHKYNYL